MKRHVKAKKETGTSRVIIGFIGAGNMAQAMMKSMSSKPGLKDIAATDKDWKKAELVSRKYRAIRCNSTDELVRKSTYIILAVKPVDLDSVLAEMKQSMNDKKIIISIVAGATIKHIQDRVGKYAVIRVMPNTPAMVGQGACGYAKSRQAMALHSISDWILKNTFKIAIEMSEKKINAVTAISGSGPAYFFYIAEAMAKAGVKLGLRGDHLKNLIGQTLLGAGEMILKSDERPEVLRQRVTSKGGTTERAIKLLEKRKVKDAVYNAVLAAKRRADELGK